MTRPEHYLTEEEFQTVVQQLDALIQEFEQLPFPQVREMVFDLLQAVDAIHREALARLISFLHEQGQADLVDRAAKDPIIHTLLRLYNLVPDEDRSPLEAVRPGVNFIPLDQIGLEPLRRPVFNAVASVEEVPVGAMKAFEVNGVYVLVANVAGKIYAVRGHCPGSMAPLHLGSFSPPIVICPWHNEAYDLRTGKRADGLVGPDLDVLPSAIVDGMIQVAVNALPKDYNQPVRIEGADR
jgi:nitrite reductase/ring-hydroxylating ferredoxin subunit